MNNKQLLSWIFPDYQNVLSGGSKEIVEMPVTYTREELTQLFRITEKDIFTRPPAEACEADPKMPRVAAANAFLGVPADKYEGIAVDAPLLCTFAFMGHASSMAGWCRLRLSGHNRVGRRMG